MKNVRAAYQSFGEIPRGRFEGVPVLLSWWGKLSTTVVGTHKRDRCSSTPYLDEESVIDLAIAVVAG